MGGADLPPYRVLPASGRTLCVETHEAWLEDKHYLNTELLAEARRERLLATA